MAEDDIDKLLEEAEQEYLNENIEEFKKKQNIMELSIEVIIEKINECIINFLKTKKDYIIFGGKAIFLYLDQLQLEKYLSKKGESLEGVKFITHWFKSLDWDIITTNNDFFNEMLENIAEQCNDLRFLMEANFLESGGLDLKQIQIKYKGNIFEIVDVHVEEKLPKYQIIDGIRIANLKYVSEKNKYGIENEDRDTKLQKRVTRQKYFLDKIQNGKLCWVKQDIKKKIIMDCKTKNNETITGFNLDCENIEFNDC